MVELPSQLKEISGIGEWTAQYIAVRDPDVFPPHAYPHIEKTQK
jgi:3-methyladenine DNA glycosylase/8-oxoguanine DNA glycosylase